MPDNTINRDTLHHLTPLAPGIEESLRAASLHALSTEGSFSRARLAQGLALSLDLPAPQAEKLGTGIELFHLASLLLDDLPCMDDAQVRRSAPCTHKLYGDSTTILSALGLINRAYCLLWKVFAESGGAVQNEAAKLTNDCLGFAGILDGQAKDIHYFLIYNDGSLVSEIAEKKTGSLLRLCLLLPAILAGASRYEKLQLANLASDWGLAYQFADDLKDLYYGESVSGKTAQRDVELGRPNMALAIGESATASLLRSLIKQARGRVDSLETSNPGKYATLQEFQTRLSEKVAPLLEAFMAA